MEIVDNKIEIAPGSLGGLYTSVEGLLTRIKTDLFSNRIFYGSGDTEDLIRNKKMNKLENELNDCIVGKMNFTLIIEDPLANSYIYSPFIANNEIDPRLKVETYIRSFEENEELGLNDLDVNQEISSNVKDDTEKAKEIMKNLQKFGDHTHPIQNYTKGGG